MSDASRRRKNEIIIFGGERKRDDLKANKLWNQLKLNSGNWARLKRTFCAVLGWVRIGYISPSPSKLLKSSDQHLVTKNLSPLLSFNYLKLILKLPFEICQFEASAPPPPPPENVIYQILNNPQGNSVLNREHSSLLRLRSLDFEWTMYSNILRKFSI